MKKCIIITLLATVSSVLAMDNNLTLVLKDHFNVPQKRITRQNELIKAELRGIKKEELINTYVLKVVHKTIMHACDELKNELVKPEKLEDAAKIWLENARNTVSGIITKKSHIKRSTMCVYTVDLEKLVKFYPENIKDILLDECEGISCPICYNYFKEEFKNPDDSMVDKTVLACSGNHALCPDDLFAYFTRHYGKKAVNKCPICLTPHHYFDAAE